MVWNLKEHRRSLPTTENRIEVIAEGDFLDNIGNYRAIKEPHQFAAPKARFLALDNNLTQGA